jgi:hypothetical protein
VFELYRSLQTFQPDEEVLNVLEKAVDVLGRLDREKEMHWSQQRTSSQLDTTVYNTGKAKPLSDVPPHIFLLRRILSEHVTQGSCHTCSLCPFLAVA